MKNSKSGLKIGAQIALKKQPNFYKESTQGVSYMLTLENGERLEFPFSTFRVLSLREFKPGMRVALHRPGDQGWRWAELSRLSWSATNDQDEGFERVECWVMDKAGEVLKCEITEGMLQRSPEQGGFIVRNLSAEECEHLRLNTPAEH